MSLIDRAEILQVSLQADTFAKLQRRAKWLNQNVFDGAINDEVGATCMLE